MRDLTTTAFEIAGLLVLAIGLGLAAATIWPPLGVLTTGSALLGAAWMTSREPRADKQESS
jgi:hypothetical protein